MPRDTDRIDDTKLEEALERLDEVLRSLAPHGDDSEDTEARELIADVLGKKMLLLQYLRRRQEATALAAEIIERFRDEETPQIREPVAAALAVRAANLLTDPDRISEALALAQELAQRLRTEPEENLVAVAGYALRLARALMSRRPGAAGLATAVGMVGFNTASVLVGSAWDAARRRKLLPAAEPLAAAAMSVRPEAIVRDGARRRQALALCEEIGARLSDESDEEAAALLVRSEQMASSIKISLGHIGAGMREISSSLERRGHGQIRAMQELADESAANPTWFSQFATISFLHQRAQALVGEDPELARLAYDDSVDERLPEQRPLLIRLLIRFLRP